MVSLPVTDFIFFIASATLNRFRDHPAIKQKIERSGDSYDVHREAYRYYRRLVPVRERVFLGPFSIRKPNGNIYGLIFGSRHQLGMHKFLQVAWANDSIAGEANFDIERENIIPGELLLDIQEMRPNKIKAFEGDLEQALRAGKIRSEADILDICIEAGMTGKHCEPILKKLKAEGVIESNFRVPDVGNYSNPRPIKMKR